MAFNKIHIWANNWTGLSSIQVDVDAYYDDAWYDVFEGVYTDIYEFILPEAQDIVKIRIRYKWHSDQIFNYGDIFNNVFLSLNDTNPTYPTSYTDVDSKWTNEEHAYDGDYYSFVQVYLNIDVWGSFVEYIMPVVISVTTQSVTQTDYQCAIGNGTIISVTNATERGFEVRLDFGEYKDSSSGTLLNYINHSIAGFVGDVTWDIVYKWNGILTKTETETGDFAEGAYELVLGYPSASYDVYGTPDYSFDDKLFKCESYTYRAYAIIDDVTYYGDYVAFSTLCDSGGDNVPSDDISEGDPTVPIIPIDTPVEIPNIIPEDILEDISEEMIEEFELPPWVLPDLPPWQYPDHPELSWVGDLYYRKPYTKKDLDELREKCIIYNKNSIEFALVLRHNMNVLREFFNMMTDYADREEFNDFTDLLPPQRLKELYLDPLEPTDFRDMINEFIRNTVDNNIAVNRNFSLIQEGLSEYETESDDAYFREITSSMKTLQQDNPDVERMKVLIDSLNHEASSNFNDIMYNLKIVRAKLL